MVNHMKTTIDIADDLLVRAKRQASREGKTLREVVDEALRQRLSATPSGPFRLRRHAFKGRGLDSSVVEGKWETVRDLIYRLG